MDLSNLKSLLDSHQSQSPDVSDDDLEDELNAILSGKSVPQRPKAVAANNASAANVKRVKQNDSKQTKSDRTARRGNQPNDTDEEIFKPNVMDFDLSAFDDIPNDDNEDIDEDDENLLSELQAITTKIGNEKVVTQQKPSADIRPPTIVPGAHSSHQSVQKPSTPVRHAPLPPPMKPLILDPIPSDTNFVKPIEKIVQQKELPKVIPNNKITEDKNEIPKLTTLKDQYKRAALMAKKSGQQAVALSHIKTAKQIEVLIKALEEGSPVDLSQLPPPPSIDSMPTTSVPANQTQESNVEFEPQNIELTTEDAQKFFNAPPPPNSVMEALEQRLNKFKSTMEQANRENNASKARRLGRIVKQYENAMKDYKKGKTMNFDELPTPPGFGPIPVTNEQKPAVPQPPVNPTAQLKFDSNKSEAKPAQDTRPSPNRPQTANKTPPKPVPSPDTGDAKSSQRPALKRASSTANKQLNYLLERQRLFKEAALESKQKGDIQQAKEYLRMAKGFDPLIEATQNGLPIDATSIPTPPQMNEDFVVVSHPTENESNENDLEREELFRKIEVELQNQIEMCKRNKEYFLQLGDISTASKFEKYAVDSRKDLDLLTIRWRNGQKLPDVKYETRTFSIVICNTEVSTSEVSVEVVKAVDIPAKSDVDTYVRLEFPFPNDNTQTARTKVVKNTINPVFNETIKFEIDRKSRQLPRVFKRHPLKLELMSKGGFLRSDSVIGTVLIKLNDLETKCTIHESFPLTEGKKVIGGRIEAKVKIREPLLAKQVEEVKEKWLSIV